MGANNFRVAGFVIGLAIKAPVRVATNAAIVLSGLQTVNGYAASINDRVLVKDQVDPIENGIYTVQTSAWCRDGDFDGNRDIVGGTIVPAYRTSDGEILLYNVDGAPASLEVGVDAITFSVYYDPTTAGIAEAPNDGMSYVRNSLAWVLEAAGSLPNPSVSSVLAGDAGGTNWLVAANITINQLTGSLSTEGSLIISDSVDTLTMSTAAGVGTMLGSGGYLYTAHIPTLRLNTGFYMLARAAALADVFAHGQFWVQSEGDNVPYFTSELGTDQLLDPSRSDINLQNGDYTTVLSDKGKTIRKSSGGAGETHTIAAEASVPYKIGTFIAFDNDGGGVLSIAIDGGDTLIFADDGTTGTRTLSSGGFAVAYKNAAGQWKIAGKQLT